ncbi:RNA demethylase ALKBH5 [Micractinium conductrix]|uniref:RNA demethylase ALKBH5 n=1 Tax=Micractinium conductrix TaxID=554055 RepID=A0A2P6VQF4_9CHLO|nr:RNA demethylase ALKBH5 [Micractinium conductrix]|eukprot:PSC76333.1 RNA demethylase ALKBH5 [Micractinium conductrix]
MTAVDHGSSDLATRLVEVRQRNASTKRCLDEGHAALAEARKRVHRLQAELSAGQQEEGEIVEALGGEAAAAAAAEGVETCTAVGSGNGRPEPAVQAAHEAALADLSQQQHHQQEQPFAIQQQEWQQQQQQPMQQQQAWQQPAMPLPGGAHAGYMLPAQSVAGPAAAKGPPPGFAGAAAAAVAAIPEPEPKPVEASPLAPFPMPGRPPRPPPPAAAAPVAPPLPLQPPPPRQPQEPPQQQQQQEEQPQPEQQPPLQQQQQQAAAPPPFRRTTGPDTANDAALAAALGAGSDSDDEDLSAAMQRVRMGHRPPAPTNAGEGLGSAGRGWGRGSAAGGRGRAPGAPPPGPPADEAPPVIGGSAADFPALGARPMSAPAPLLPAPAVPAPALQPTGTANGQQPRGWGSGAWGSQSLLAKLAASAPPAPDGPAEAQRAAQQAAPPAGVASVEVLEARAGLRVPGDATPDATRKRQVQQQRQTFEHKEPSIKGGRHTVNVVEGLELHRGVLTPAEQALVVDEVERWKALGTSGHLRGRTFSASKKWLPGKGRVTMQFGCCYNYARDQLGRDPGIIPDEVVEPMPLLLRALCRRLTRWGLLPAAKEPNSAIINIYEAGDCIPPHVDHFDFIRPFCTLSLLSEQSIMFGQRLAPAGPGEFVGHGGETVLIPLPKGSCLVLKGHGGDSAMHCVPPVAERRISITLRRMAPEHEAAVQREVQKLGAAHGGRLLGFWEQEAAGGGGGRRGSGSVMIK